MRLGFYYHIPAMVENGKILVPGYLGRFLDSLAVHCEHLVLFLHAPDENENANFDYAIQSKNTTLELLPPRGSVPNRMLNARKFTRVIQKSSENLDAVLLRAPSPLVPAIANAIGHRKSIFLIVGDYLAGVNSLPQPRWRKEAIRWWSWWYGRQQLRVSHQSLIFVNSRMLYDQLQGKVAHLYETRTTTLTRADLYWREDTCQNTPIQLLYTGRMDPAKGLMDMVQAVAILEKQGIDTLLNLVGWAESTSSILEDLNQLSHSLQITDRVVFHGYKPVGEELFAMYRQADIFVIASQSSFEGFPRTIWEAMANCVPVVATRVGSIPSFVSDCAELVAPRKPQELAKAIKKIIANSELRRSNIKKGYILVNENCLEFQSEKLMTQIKNWVNKNELHSNEQ